MTFFLSRKGLVLSKSVSILQKIKEAANSMDFEVEENFPPLTSLDSIIELIQKNKSTAFLRTELLRFFKERGFPYFIAIDFTIDTGLEKKLDPDKMKILRTFLISYIILSRGKDFSQLQGNFILFYNNQDKNKIASFQNNPQNILNNLATKDKIINSFIEELKKDFKSFTKLFILKCLNKEDNLEQIISELKLFTGKINIKNKYIPVKKEEKTSTIDKTDYDPANILYKFSETKIYINGEIKDISDKYKELKDDRMYLQGHWTNKTLAEVANKISKAIKSGLGKNKSFKAGQEILIDINQKTIIDSTIIMSISQLTSKELIDYKTIFLINEKNREMLENSTGFNFIKNNVKFMSL